MSKAQIEAVTTKAKGLEEEAGDLQAIVERLQRGVRDGSFVSLEVLDECDGVAFDWYHGAQVEHNPYQQRLKGCVRSLVAVLQSRIEECSQEAAAEWSRIQLVERTRDA